MILKEDLFAINVLQREEIYMIHEHKPEKMIFVLAKY
jgi:hypothetical protein